MSYSCRPDDGAGRCGHAETDNADIEGSIESIDMYWEEWLEAIMSQCQASANDVQLGLQCAQGLYVNETDYDANVECSRECFDICQTLLEAAQAPDINYDCKPNILPACPSSNIVSMQPSLPNCMNALLMESSPVIYQHDSHPLHYMNNIHEQYSISMSSALPNTNALFNMDSSPLIYQHDSHPLDSITIHDSHPPHYMNLHDLRPLYTNNHGNDHLNINMHDDHATNSMQCVSFSPMYYGNAPMNADEYCSDEAPLLAAMFASPPCQEQHFPMSGTGPRPPNLAIHSQINLEAGSSLQNFEAAHYMNKTRAFINSADCEARKTVNQLLVESSTPAIEDGYKWWKYGQKNIKDKMHPRCYFKCAQRNCPVKKQTEVSSDMPGFVLITYFGKHNHL